MIRTLIASAAWALAAASAQGAAFQGLRCTYHEATTAPDGLTNFRVYQPSINGFALEVAPAKLIPVTLDLGPLLSEAPGQYVFRNGQVWTLDGARYAARHVDANGRTQTYDLGQCRYQLPLRDSRTVEPGVTNALCGTVRFGLQACVSRTGGSVMLYDRNGLDRFYVSRQLSSTWPGAVTYMGTTTLDLGIGYESQNTVALLYNPSLGLGRLLYLAPNGVWYPVPLSGDFPMTPPSIIVPHGAGVSN